MPHEQEGNLVEAREEEFAAQTDLPIDNPHLSPEQQARFSDMYEASVKRIYSYFSHKANSVQDAQDLTSDVFFRALRRYPDYERPDNDMANPDLPWLFKITHNVLTNYYRGRGRAFKYSVEVPDTVEGKENVLFSYDPSSEQKMIDKENQAKIRKYISYLPERYQRVIYLKQGEEKITNKEIGIIMGITEGAVKSTYFRALVRIKGMIENK